MPARLDQFCLDVISGELSAGLTIERNSREAPEETTAALLDFFT